MPRDWFDEFFDQPYFICEDGDQGAKIKAICVLLGVQVDEAFVVGPINIRPRDEEKDSFPEHTRFDFQSSVLELNYVDREAAHSMYAEPMRIQEAAFKAAQLLVNNWSGISLIYHFDGGNELVGTSGYYRYATADTEPPRERGILSVTDENKELFRKIFRASFGDLAHAIDRFSRACTEIRNESILDFVIALESTLGYRLDTEIAHRLASRGAFLLTLDPSERDRYYAIFKTLYNARSSIAHGGTVTAKIPKPFVEAITSLGYWAGDWTKQPDFMKVRHIADIARQVSRQVLIEFIKRPGLLNQGVLLKLELGIAV